MTRDWTYYNTLKGKFPERLYACSKLQFVMNSPLKKRNYCGLERWLNILKHWLLLKRIKVLFPDPNMVAPNHV